MEKENNVLVTYNVKNTDKQEMYFSVGAHPAFAVPLVTGTVFEDYYLQFNQKEDAGIWPLSDAGLIKEVPVTFFIDTDRLALRKSLFYGDALVFKALQSTSISILCNKHPHGLCLTYSNFPYMGIWSAKDADFICIEPWCGIADSVTASGKLEEKEGIYKLTPGEEFQRDWSITLF